jgi:8-oxo-dGTP pyrophosphatase MutT (NUDIX family)
LQKDFNVPTAKIFVSNPQYTQFITRAYIISDWNDKEIDIHTAGNANPQPRVLLLQRSLTDDYGGYWERLGRTCEHTESMMLSSPAREVFEESGLHVSRILDLVAVENWEFGSTTGGKAKKAAKYSVLVDVHERVPRSRVGAFNWEQQVTMAPKEYEQFRWGTEE